MPAVSPITLIAALSAALATAGLQLPMRGLDVWSSPGAQLQLPRLPRLRLRRLLCQLVLSSWISSTAAISSNTTALVASIGLANTTTLHLAIVCLTIATTANAANVLSALLHPLA